MTNAIKQLRDELKRIDQAILSETSWGAATTARMERRQYVVEELARLKREGE